MPGRPRNVENVAWYSAIPPPRRRPRSRAGPRRRARGRTASGPSSSLVEHHLVGQVLVVGEGADQRRRWWEGPRARHRGSARAPTVASGGGARRRRELLEVLHDAATAVRDGPRRSRRLGARRARADHQYRHDLVADAAALSVLRRAGLGVLSEESGVHEPGGGDPGRARSGGRLDQRQPRHALVEHQPVRRSTPTGRGPRWWWTRPRGARFEAVRGGGARLDGRPIAPSACTRLGEAVIGLNGYPRQYLGWKQFRALGATALDLCAVAAGILDGYVDCTRRGSAPWDYLGRDAGVSGGGRRDRRRRGGGPGRPGPDGPPHAGRGGHPGAARRTARCRTRKIS